VPSPSDPRATAPSDDVAAELQALRARIDVLAAENATLREQLARSDAAREDLFAQSRHVLELLAWSRHELRQLQARAAQ
jgi:hypothetical protein